MPLYYYDVCLMFDRQIVRAVWQFSGLIFYICTNQFNNKRQKKRVVCTSYILLLLLGRYLCWWTINPSQYHPSQGRIQDFKIGRAHLKKLRREEGGAKMFGVFRVKNHDFTPKKSYFFQFEGRHAPGAPPPPVSAPASFNQCLGNDIAY
jgi:ABC-type nickel/cobalt efflux system permease component RcnA